MGGRSVFERGGSVVGGFVVGRHLDCSDEDGRWKMEEEEEEQDGERGKKEK